MDFPTFVIVICVKGAWGLALRLKPPHVWRFLADIKLTREYLIGLGNVYRKQYNALLVLFVHEKIMTYLI